MEQINKNTALLPVQNIWLSILIVASCIATSSCESITPKYNVIKNSPSIAKDAFSSIEPTKFDTADFQASDGTKLPYRFLTPSHGIQGQSYPLVLQLHGSGGVGTDNLTQLDRLAKTWAASDVRERYQAYVLIPQLPIRSANYGPPSSDQHAEPTSALNAALELVEDFTAHHAVDKSRIYAVGFSMGGSAAWLSPALRPNLFAAVVPVSGIAPADSSAPTFKNLSILIIHGNSDTENPITADRRFFNELVRIGGKNIQFREYDGIDHQLPAEIYPGYWWRDWLFKQSRQ